MQSEKELDMKFFLAQRDKHLDQFMAINAKAAFAAATAIVGLILGADRLKVLELPESKSLLFVIVFGVGIFFLFVGTYLFARFHTKKIREFENLSADCDKEQTQRDREHYQIIPTASLNNPLNCVLAGIGLCVIAAFLVLYWVVTASTAAGGPV